MVAGLTADVFVQLTATLAHLSSTLNKTNKFGGKNNFAGNNRIDLPATLTPPPPLPIDRIIYSANTNISIDCPQIHTESYVSNLEWFCYGCHQDLYTTNNNRAADITNDQSENNVGIQHNKDNNNPHQLIVDSGVDKVRRVVGFGNSGRLVRLPSVGQDRLASRRIRLRANDFDLEFWPVKSIDEGDYFCLVNGRERPSKVTRLMVRDVPDPPGRPIVDSFTSRSVNLSWPPPLDTHHSPVMHYLIHVRRGEQGAWQMGHSLRTENNNTVYQVTNLNPFTTYSFRVTAVNSHGPSDPSPDSYYTMTLRSVPTGRPIITSAINASSSSIKISWKPPPTSSINGELLGYRIAYKKMNGSNNINEVMIKDPEITSYKLQGLKAFTHYLISIQVFNPEGLGPSAAVEVTTDEGVPSMPMNVRTIDITNTSVRLSWETPAEPRGKILGYRLYFMKNTNFTDVVTVRMTGRQIRYTLLDLKPYTNYKFWVKAFTWKNEGESSSPPISALTDVFGPSEPQITNLTCEDDTSLFIEWSKPTQVAHSVDFYFINYERSRDHEAKVIMLDAANRAFKDRKILLSNLTKNAVYRISVQGATLSLYREDKLYKGRHSTQQQVQLANNCDTVKAFTVLESENQKSKGTLESTAFLNPFEDLGVGIIAGIALVALVISISIIAFILKRKLRQHDSLYYVSENSSGSGDHHQHHHHHPMHKSASTIVESVESVSMKSLRSQTGENTLLKYAKPIPISVFLSHVDNLRMNGGFAKEFRALNEWEKRRIREWTGPGSPKKAPDYDRYNNIIAYDHSRVKLNTIKKKNDYINASYIDGFESSRNYIATQGPLPTTFTLFWKMVWQCNVRVIVMMTNLVESGQSKCDRYWPDHGPEAYGNIQVTLMGQEVLCNYVIRTFRVSHSKESGDLVVRHFQFLDWPHEGVPSDSIPIISFVRKASDANRDSQQSPILVHCSGGAGRTAIFIVLDSMLKKMKKYGEIDVLGYLKKIRAQRNFMVQTEEQYVFIHEALAEAVAAGETNISRTYLSRYINTLQSNFTTDENSVSWQLLDSQFKLITLYQAPDCEYSQALCVGNKEKNRTLDVLPTETCRVCIGGINYVNASWIPGFYSHHEYIIAQHPMDQTIQDFWSLLYEYSIQTVILLTAFQNKEFGQFWPEQGAPLEFGDVRICVCNEGVSHDFPTKCFSIHSSSRQTSVCIIFCPGWPMHQSKETTFSLISLIHSVQKQQQPMSPIVVVDKVGGTEAGSLCALATLVRQLNFDHHADVYSLVRQMHRVRPGLWRQPEDILAIYKMVETYIAMNESATGQVRSVEELERIATERECVICHHTSQVS